ncbi:hypothetical protein C2E23DRAFT_14169 [Lenzites betulinus]|nr:hypothetical protein C2E23DRAFT_14169 [Lenzites betulinus]
MYIPKKCAAARIYGTISRGHLDCNEVSPSLLRHHILRSCNMCYTVAAAPVEPQPYRQHVPRDPRHFQRSRPRLASLGSSFPYLNMGAVRWGGLVSRCTPAGLCGQ